MEKASFHDDCEADKDSRCSMMEPIGYNLDDFHIHSDHSVHIGTSDDEGDDTHESEESEEDDDREKHEEIAHPKILSDKLKGSAFACSTSSLASAELASAIKGSREKTGTVPRVLRVTWAPDVYEPNPTKLQDTVTRGTKQRKFPKKENMVVKEGRKGKETLRGGGSKDSTRAGGGKEKKKKRNHRVNGRGSYGYPDYGDADDY